MTLQTRRMGYQRAQKLFLSSMELSSESLYPYLSRLSSELHPTGLYINMPARKETWMQGRCWFMGAPSWRRIFGIL